MNPLPRFMDTGYWLALMHTGDQYHLRASALSHVLTPPLVTTEAVLIEVGNAFAGERFRTIGVGLLADIRSDPAIEIVPVTTELLERAIALYTARPDKEWGLTDCVSFVVMQERGITEALAADQHFVQAGFRALLREGAH